MNEFALALGLCLVSFAAGFIDAIAGGGGLLMIPAMFVLLPPSLAPATILGTNKFAAFAGTSAAAVRYARAVKLDRGLVAPAALLAMPLSFLGARIVHYLNPALFRPLVLVLLIAAAIYTFVQKDFGALHTPQLSGYTRTVVAAAIGAAIGFYDGFFGPGTGSFLIFAFVGIFGCDFLHASASAKIINCGTNIAALAYFLISGNVLFRYAIPMAVCNIAGGLVGARLAILKGSAFVRVLFLIVILAVITRFAWDVLAHK